jgi:hypothetical protein
LAVRPAGILPAETNSQPGEKPGLPHRQDARATQALTDALHQFAHAIVRQRFNAMIIATGHGMVIN